MTRPPRMTDAEIKTEAARHVAEYRATPMIERVGEALSAECLKIYGSTWSIDVRREFARIAIAAMREPTAAMKATGADCYGSGCSWTGTWQAMIDAALPTQPDTAPEQTGDHPPAQP